MDSQTIILAAASAAGFLLLTLLLFALRGRRAARRAAVAARDDAARRATLVESHRSGEREATWALSETARALRNVRSEQTSSVATERAIDDLRDRLVAADTDLARARRDADEARSESARLETEISALSGRLEIIQATIAIEGSPLEDDTTSDLSARLASSQQELADARAELAALRSQDGDTLAMDTEGGGTDRDRLVSSEARRRELEDRLAALTAIRASEQRTASDRIAALERVHLQVDEHDARVRELEAAVREAQQERDRTLSESDRLQVELGRLRNALTTAQRRLESVDDPGTALVQARARIAELEGAGAATESPPGQPPDASPASVAQPGPNYASWDAVVRDRVNTAVASETARLTDQIAQLRAVVAEKEERLKLLTTARGGKAISAAPPKITDIKGIGPVIAGILAEHGITSVEDVAGLTEQTIARLSEVMPVYPGRIHDDDWVGQARSLL